jgi:hypothetical protein
MAHIRQVALLAALSNSLQERSVDLSEVGSAEYGFPVDCADEVFNSLIQNGFAILGGDLWRKTGAKFEPVFDGWYTDSLTDEAVLAWHKFLDLMPSGPEYFTTFVVR